MNVWIIYLLLKLDTIINVAKFFTIVAGICCVVSIAVRVISIMDNWSTDFIEKYGSIYKKIAIPSLVVFLLAGIALTFTPTTKQMCAIYLIPKIANNEKIQNIGDKSLTIVEKKFEEWVDDITKK